MTDRDDQSPPSTAKAGASTAPWAVWVSRWPLKTRLTLVASVPLVALLLGGLLSLAQLHSANETMGSIYRDRVVPLRQLKQVADAFAVDLVDQTQKRRDGAVGWDDARRTLANARRAADTAWGNYLATYLVAEERDLIAIVRPRLQRAHELAQTLDGILARQDPAALQRFAAQDMYPTVDSLSQAINALMQIQLDESQRLYEDSGRVYRKVLVVMLLALMLVLLGAAGFAWLVSHSTIRSIRHAADAATAVAQGDLSQAIDDQAGGETGMLLAAIESIRVQLRCSMEDMVQLLKIIPVPMLSARPNQDEVRDVNPAFERHFGLRRDEVVGRQLHELPIWLDEAALAAWRGHRQGMEAGEASLRRAELMTRDGRGEASRCEVTTMVRRKEQPPAMLLTFEDVTVRRAHEQELHDRAVHDTLTGLPNRAGIEQELANAWVAWRQRRQPFAVVMVDLDGFKPINDSLGHAAGDAVLAEVARRMLALSRASDLCGRWGGDEFVLVLNGCASLRQALASAQRMLEAIALPLQVGEQACRVGASLGVAHSVADFASAEDLLLSADQWMYAAKAAGKNRVAPPSDGGTTDEQPDQGR